MKFEDTRRLVRGKVTSNRQGIPADPMIWLSNIDIQSSNKYKFVIGQMVN